MNANIPRRRVCTPFERVEDIATRLVALGFHPHMRCFRSHLRIEVELCREGDQEEWRAVRAVFGLGDRWGIRTVPRTHGEGITRPVWIVVHKTSTTGSATAAGPARRRVVVPAARDRRQAFALACRLGMVPEAAT